MGIAEAWRAFRSQPLATVRQWQNYRLTWGIMLATAVFLEAVAFYFQFGMDMRPCEYCVYQRLAVLIIGAAALIMLLAPRNKAVRGAGYGLWISGAVYGIHTPLCSWRITPISIRSFHPVMRSHLSLRSATV